MEHTAGGSASTTNIPATATTSSAAEDASSLPPTAAVSHEISDISRRFEHLLDKTMPYLLYRWIVFLCIALTYVVRVYLVGGFYVVTYALGIYVLNLVIGFISPREDPELSDGPTLPVRSSDEFRPFIRRLPEFKFWRSITTAFCIAILLTFFSIFDIPVFWPILLIYWILLSTVTLRKQIQHMIKYNYVPFNFGKQRYDGKRESSVKEKESLLS